MHNTTLGKMKKGESGVILSYCGGKSEYKRKLLSMGLIPGSPFTITRVAPLGDPIEIKICGSRLSLRKKEADIISVDTSNGSD